MRGTRLLDDRTFAATDELVSLGREISARSPVAPPAGKGRWWRSPRMPRRVLAGVAVAVIVAAVVWTGMIRRGESNRLPAELTDPIRLAIAEYFDVSGMLVPGGEHAAYLDGPATRSGTATADSAFEASIDALYRRYRENENAGPGGRVEGEYWLAVGYLVDSRLPGALYLADRLHERFPSDVRVTTLRAIIAYIDDDLDTAENLLRGVWEADAANYTAAINLAHVLTQREEHAEAKRLLTTVRDRNPGTPLAERAEALLSEI
jgi:hypothetical protein